MLKVIIIYRYTFTSYRKSYYTPALKKRVYSVLGLSILPSVRLSAGPFVCPSVCNQYFCRTSLINHALQPIQTWYGALARGPTGCLRNSGPPAIYFLF